MNGQRLCRVETRQQIIRKYEARRSPSCAVKQQYQVCVNNPEPRIPRLWVDRACGLCLHGNRAVSCAREYTDLHGSTAIFLNSFERVLN